MRSLEYKNGWREMERREKEKKGVLIALNTTFFFRAFYAVCWGARENQPKMNFVESTNYF